VTESPTEDPRDALIREQAAQIDQLTVRIALHDELAARQDERIAALTALAVELREQLDAALRAVSRNSGNSSMPPSSDDLPGRMFAGRMGATTVEVPSSRESSGSVRRSWVATRLKTRAPRHSSTWACPATGRR